MPLRPWSPIPIHDCGEPLLPIAGALWRLEPHPYLALGAPYGPDGNPFLLRSGVVDRLLQAQQALQLEHPDLRLAIFDGWRPLAVQRFMVRHALVAECRRLGVDPDADSPERALVAAEVGRFWAPPSGDPATPPPHSTGAAVDLTLADGSGAPLPMGGAIDAIGPISEPAFHAAAARLDPGGGGGSLAPAPALAGRGDGCRGLCPASQRVVALQLGGPAVGLAQLCQPGPLRPGGQGGGLGTLKPGR